jgi:uncharacterized delta-60 repeat protein
MMRLTRSQLAVLVVSLFSVVSCDDGGGDGDGGGTVNQPPVAVDDAYSVDEDAVLTVDAAGGVMANDTDPEGATLTAQVNDMPANGSLTMSADGAFTYTPPTNFNGTDTFTYQVDDGLGNDTAMVTVTVNPVNDPPIATWVDSMSTTEDTTSAGYVPNVSDPDSGETFTFTIVIQPANGTASVVSNELVYTPDADFAGSDSFTFRATDSGGAFVEGTASVGVAEVNDAPTATSATLTIPEDTSPGGDIVVSVTDVDIGDSYTYEILTQPANGTAVSIGPSQVRYTPDADFEGTDTFTYRVTDSGSQTVDGTATITVTPVNDAPTAADITISTDEDTPSTPVTPVVTDIDLGDTITITLQTSGAIGVASVVSNQLVYTPAANAYGTDTFNFIATDSGGLFDIASATVTIASIEDVPVISGTPATTVDSGSAYSFTPTASDGDIGDTVTFSIANKPSWAEFNTFNGALSGTPDNDDAGVVSTLYAGIVITATDNDGDSADLAAFSITVNDVTPPANPASLTLTAGDGVVDLAWADDSAAADLSGTMVLRRDDGVTPTGPTDSLATVVYDGIGEAYSDTAVTNGTTYRYALYSHDEVPNYSGAASGTATPRAGGYDAMFGSDGKVVFDTANDERGEAVVIDGSGRYVIGGTIDGALTVWRYNPDGTPDLTFGGDYAAPAGPDGYVTGPGDGATDIVIDDAGNILATGNQGLNLIVCRFTPDGALDSGAGRFGEDYDTSGEPDGYVRFDRGGGFMDAGLGITLDASERILVTGWTYVGAIDAQMGLWRFTADGVLDTTFAAPNGYTTYDNSTGTADRGTDVVVDGSGNILVAGASVAGTIDMFVWRYTSEGVLDVGNFGEDYDAAGGVDGYFRHDYAGGGQNADYGFGMTLDGTGNIIVTGQSQTASSSAATLWRITPAGVLDTSFDSDGHRTFAGSSSGDVVVDSQGRIIACANSSGGSVFITRLLADGSLDPAFQTQPLSDIVAASSSDYSADLTVDAEDNIIVTGYGIASLDEKMFIIRLSGGVTPPASGSLDTDFDGVGYVVYAGTGSGEDQGDEVRVDAAGNIVVAGRIHNGSDLDVGIWRFDSDGAPDNTFDGDGVLIQSNATLGNNEDYASAMTLDGSGNIILTGFISGSSNGDMGLWRHSPTGAQELSQVHDGAAGGPGQTDQGYAVTMGGVGDYLIAGRSRNTYDRMVIWNYDAAGVLVNSFDADGIAIYDNALGDSVGRAIVRDASSGDILVAGDTRLANGPINQGCAVWRYDSAGVPVGSFGTGGVVTHDGPGVGTELTDVFDAVALDALGNILAAGYSVNASGDFDAILVRYDPSGVLDGSFGVGGVATYDSGDDDAAFAMALDASGRILLAGYIFNGVDHDMATWRFDTNGSLDSTFGTGGVVTHDNAAGGTSTDAGFGITIAPSGKILVTGISTNADTTPDSDMVIWRINP